MNSIISCVTLEIFFAVVFGSFHFKDVYKAGCFMYLNRDIVLYLSSKNPLLFQESIFVYLVILLMRE